jgi:glycine/D-amino acid oxidase-like deaminating enzyme
MRTRDHFVDSEVLMAMRRRRHAVVVGGSMAGMLAAHVLSDHFAAVTLLERDQFPETPAARKGLPPGRLDEAAWSTGLSRTALHATELGYPIYRAMGYRQVAFFRRLLSSIDRQ